VKKTAPECVLSEVTLHGAIDLSVRPLQRSESQDGEPQGAVVTRTNAYSLAAGKASRRRRHGSQEPRALSIPIPPLSVPGSGCRELSVEPDGPGHHPHEAPSCGEWGGTAGQRLGN
jgi:hypothetical protein